MVIHNHSTNSRSHQLASDLDTTISLLNWLEKQIETTIYLFDVSKIDVPEFERRLLVLSRTCYSLIRLQWLRVRDFQVRYRWVTVVVFNQ